MPRIACRPTTTASFTYHAPSSLPGKHTYIQTGGIQGHAAGCGGEFQSRDNTARELRTRLTLGPCNVPQNLAVSGVGGALGKGPHLHSASRHRHPPARPSEASGLRRPRGVGPARPPNPASPGGRSRCRLTRSGRSRAGRARRAPAPRGKLRQPGRTPKVQRARQTERPPLGRGGTPAGTPPQPAARQPSSSSRRAQPTPRLKWLAKQEVPPPRRRHRRRGSSRWREEAEQTAAGSVAGGCGGAERSRVLVEEPARGPSCLKGA